MIKRPLSLETFTSFFDQVFQLYQSVESSTLRGFANQQRCNFKTAIQEVAGARAIARGRLVRFAVCETCEGRCAGTISDPAGGGLL
jgi:hypothetical protein